MNREFYYEFSIEVEGLSDEHVDQLYDAGCDDALVAGSNNRIFVDFCRLSTSYGEAVKSAIENIEKAGGTVVDIVRIDYENPPEHYCMDQAGEVVEDPVEHYARNAKLYVGVVVAAGRRLMERARTSFYGSDVIEIAPGSPLDQMAKRHEAANAPKDEAQQP